jgi:hypothetical protein
LPSASTLVMARPQPKSQVMRSRFEILQRVLDLRMYRY